MPIVIPKAIPAYKVLSNENIFVMEKKRAARQDIRPIEIAILNLMPTKIETENQLLRLLSNTPLQVHITLIKTESYNPRNTSHEHLERFYKTYSQIKHKKFDGMIITGAPVEQKDFHGVAYWEELEEILNYAKNMVTSTIFICWGAQAALYHYYGIEKQPLAEKLFGVYKNRAVFPHEPLLKGLNDTFSIPHSRHTAVDAEALRRHPSLCVLAEGTECGISIAKAKDANMFFFFGHSEYDPETLKKEYLRDKEAGLPIAPPKNYFADDKEDAVNFNWNSTGNLLFYNWLNYYVYQITPYQLKTGKA